MAAAARRDFDPGRISPGETIAGGAGIALFLFLFLHWFEGANAWSTFDVVDFLLAAIALLAVAVAGARAMGNDLLGRNTGLALTLAGTVATSIILTFVLEGDGRKIGLWLSFLAAIALTYGGWRVISEAPGTRGPLAGMSAATAGTAAATNPTAPTTPMPAAEPGVPGGGAAGVSPGKEGPGAPHPGTSIGAPGEEGGEPEPPAAGGDPVPGQTGAQTPPGLAGEPPPGGGTHTPGL
jgi:hypothetical protein